MVCDVVRLEIFAPGMSTQVVLLVERCHLWVRPDAMVAPFSVKLKSSPAQTMVEVGTAVPPVGVPEHATAGVHAKMMFGRVVWGPVLVAVAVPQRLPRLTAR